LLLSEEPPNIDMENRVDRRNDESLYQPKIHSERIRALYNLKQVTGKPMTVLLDLAIRNLAENYGTVYHAEDVPEPVPALELPDLVTVDEETWEEICEYRRLLDELEVLRLSEELEKIKNEQGRTII
jgi:hypothetical protein